MKLVPIGDRVVIKKIDMEEKTKGGIVLPSSAKEQPSMAEVLAIGADILNDDKKKDVLAVGDRVIFSKYAGTEVNVDGDEQTVVKFADILAVVK